jgi:hypothetical protein
MLAVIRPPSGRLADAWHERPIKLTAVRTHKLETELMGASSGQTWTESTGLAPG